MQMQDFYNNLSDEDKTSFLFSFIAKIETSPDWKEFIISLSSCLRNFIHKAKVHKYHNKELAEEWRNELATELQNTQENDAKLNHNYKAEILVLEALLSLLENDFSVEEFVEKLTEAYAIKSFMEAKKLASKSMRQDIIPSAIAKILQ